MKLSTLQYGKMLEGDNISVIYSGPIWAGGIDSIAELMLKRFEYDDLPTGAAQSVFSIFVEQMNNMLMYSAEKESAANPEAKQTEASKGLFILGVRGSEYFIQTGNVVTPQNAKILKNRIDYINTLDKKGLRKFYMRQLNAGNDNPESKGAGIGLIEVARRASAPIGYELEPYPGGLQYFTMYITVRQGDRE